MADPNATTPTMTKTAEGRIRANETRERSTRVDRSPMPPPHYAGAHAADHLINPDATPGAGALPSYAPGREADGAAG